ncbi:unnamed protein product [Closterium sp. Naga37s-1]|nr:unnamed protein product [Closterium sp. Naga37s-1]
MAGSGEHGGGNPRNPGGRGERAEQMRTENGYHADGECAPGERGEAAGATVQAGSAHADRQRGEEPAAASSDAANGWLVLDGERKAAGSSGVAETGRHRSSSIGDSQQQVDNEYAEPYQFAQSLVSLSHNPDSPVISNCATCGRHGPPGSCACAPLTPLRQRGAAAAGSGGRDYSDVPQLKLESGGTADAQVAQRARIGVTVAAVAGGEAAQERGEKRMAQQQQQQRALRFASSVDVRRIATGGSSDKLANGAEGGESRAQQQVAQKAWAEGFDAIERGLVAAVKGFAIGAGLRGGLSLFSLLGRLRRRRARIASGDKDAAAAAGVWEGVVGVVREGVRYGMFVGTFAGSYCVLDEGIAAVGGHDKTRRWRALLAGAAAAPSLLLAGPNTRHTSLALYVLLRAVVLAVRCGIKSPSWGWLFRPLTWRHGDTLLMCISAAQILSAWMLEPHSLPATYVSFLNKHGGKPACVYQAMNEMALHGRVTPACTADLAAMLARSGGKGGGGGGKGGMKLPWTRVVPAHEAVIPCDLHCFLLHGPFAHFSPATSSLPSFPPSSPTLLSPPLPSPALPSPPVSSRPLPSPPVPSRPLPPPPVPSRPLPSPPAPSRPLPSPPVPSRPLPSPPVPSRPLPPPPAPSRALSTVPAPHPHQFLHPGGWCWWHFLSFLPAAYMRAVPVYVPVYLVPALLVHRSSLLRQPLSIALRTALGAARSSLFLATYCGTAWFWTCNIHQLVGKCTRATMAGGAFLCGLAVLLEKKSRRMELALYCFSRAIESYFICLASWGVLPPLSSLALFPALAKRYLSTKSAAGAPGGVGVGSRASAGGCRGGGIVKESLSGVLPVAAAVLQPHALLDVALLAAAAGVIMQCYQSERDVFRSKYLNVLDWIFGVPKGQKAASELNRRRSPQVHALEHAKPRSLSLPAFSLPASAAGAASGTSRAFAGILPPANLPRAAAPGAGAAAARSAPGSGNLLNGSASGEQHQQCNGMESADKVK